MKPCIFLDIDGVINPNRKSTTYHFDYSLPNTLAKKLNHPKIANLNVYLVNQVYSCFSKESINYLKQLIEKYNAVVLRAKCKNVANKMQKIGFKKRHFKRLLNAK